jgi:hypothetical protein
MPIRPGQIYESCDPRGGPRIRITSYRPGDARAQVVDAIDGKRFRQILAAALHETGETSTRQIRRTGYRLAQDAPAASTDVDSQQVSR